jgi:hypothetical protein
MTEPELKLREFEALPHASSCRLIDFEQAEVHPGFVSGTYILIVRGTKPYLNMEAARSASRFWRSNSMPTPNSIADLGIRDPEAASTFVPGILAATARKSVECPLRVLVA